MEGRIGQDTCLRRVARRFCGRGRQWRGRDEGRTRGLTRSRTTAPGPRASGRFRFLLVDRPCAFAAGLLDAIVALSAPGRDARGAAPAEAERRQLTVLALLTNPFEGGQRLYEGLISPLVVIVSAVSCGAPNSTIYTKLRRTPMSR